MKILFDTNVVLGVLMDREPFSDAAAELFATVEDGSGIGYLCATTLTTVYYLNPRLFPPGDRKNPLLPQRRIKLPNPFPAFFTSLVSNNLHLNPRSGCPLTKLNNLRASPSLIEK